MSRRGLFLGLPAEEVQAAMQEEGCLQCFGCPHATVIAAELVGRTNLELDFVNTLQGLREFSSGADADTGLDSDTFLAEKRQELKILTEECRGYSETPRMEGRPAKMCDSPESPDPKISVFAGRIIEFLSRI